MKNVAGKNKILPHLLSALCLIALGLGIAHLATGIRLAIFYMVVFAISAAVVYLFSTSKHEIGRGRFWFFWCTLLFCFVVFCPQMQGNDWIILLVFFVFLAVWVMNRSWRSER